MGQRASADARDIFTRNFRIRFYRALDYLTLFLYVLVVSVGALITDYLIVFAIEQVVATAVSRYPIVAQAFDWFQIGSAFLALIAAGAHAFLSAWSQIRFEWETARVPLSGGEASGKR